MFGDCRLHIQVRQEEALQKGYRQRNESTIVLRYAAGP